MHKIALIGFLLLLVACQNKISEQELSLLNGYWEIDKVTLANGQIKEYKVNTTVDYIELKDLSGYRKKVYPKFDGSFDTSNDAEYFTILDKKDHFEIYYKSELSEWVEILNTLDENTFTVTNTENITYNYKRFKPISVSK
jgi:pectate lyase